MLIDPAMFGMGGGQPPMGGAPGPDPGMQTPGQPNPMAGPAMDALGQLGPKSPNPTMAMQKMEEALDLAYRLVTSVIAQAQNFSPKVVKSGHGVARSILTMKSDLREDIVPGPTPDLMLGMGMAGAPAAPGAGPEMGGGSPPGMGM